MEANPLVITLPARPSFIGVEIMNALILALSLLHCVAGQPSSSSSVSQQLSEERVAKIIKMLELNNSLRYSLERGATGDGVHQVDYVHTASEADEHIKRVREWARDVWVAWSEHHNLARQLISEAPAAMKV